MTHTYESTTVVSDHVLLEIRCIRHFKGLYGGISGFRSTVGGAQGSDCVGKSGLRYTDVRFDQLRQPVNESLPILRPKPCPCRRNKRRACRLDRSIDILAPAAGTVVMISPVAGSRTSGVASSAASTHSPPINLRCCSPRKCRTVSGAPDNLADAGVCSFNASPCRRRPRCSDRS
jgi:hypothetical protein